MATTNIMEITAFCPATGFRVSLEYESVAAARERNPHLRDFRLIRYKKQ